MHTLYWIPRPGDPTPRLVAYDDMGRRSPIKGSKVDSPKGTLMFRFLENEYNRHRMANVKEPWHKELPIKGSKTVQKPIVTPEPPINLEEPDIDKTPITRAELMEILESNGIAYRKNLKSVTLFEKLPNDIARNFFLAQSKLEVQT